MCLSPPSEKRNSQDPNGNKHDNTNDDRPKDQASVFLQNRTTQPQNTDKLRHKEHRMITERRGKITSQKSEISARKSASGTGNMKVVKKQASPTERSIIHRHNKRNGTHRRSKHHHPKESPMLLSPLASFAPIRAVCHCIRSVFVILSQIFLFHHGLITATRSFPP